MGMPIPEATRDAIVRELEANEFRAGEFYQTLADRYDVSAWSVRMMAVSAKRARGAS